MKITEKKIIEKYLLPLTFKNRKSLNLSDDVYYDFKKKIIFSTDTYEEGVHFLNSANPNNFIKKIFRSTISDILCKGAKPYVYFLSLSLKKANYKWINNFSKILSNESKKYGLFLGGGDTVKSKKFSITISAIGNANYNPILRKNAKIMDDIYITGNLGESFLGLSILKNKINLGKSNNFYKKAYFEPNIPFKFSKHLCKFANSSIDISDGLLKDLSSLCLASKCSAKILFLNIPFSKKTLKLSKKKKINLSKIFSKGDDYQVLFTANKKYRKIIKKYALKTSTKVSRIGMIGSGNGVKMIKGDKIVSHSSINSGYMHTF